LTPPPDTIIVGAGAAGLMCARELTRAGKRVVVLEASTRVGGRVHTLHDTGAGIPIELGAEFVHGDAPVTTQLLEEARLSTVRVLGEHYRSDDGELANQGPAFDRMSRVFKRLDPPGAEDRSFQEFLDDEPGGAPLADEREMARGFVQGFNGADVRLVSVQSLAEQGDPTEGAVESRRIVSGYAALIEHLRRDVARVIRLRSTVKRIAWDERGVRVTDAKGKRHPARTVVLTVPLPMLQDDGIVIEPDVPALRHAARQLEMGHVARVSVVVKERFWEKKELDKLSYLHAPMRPFNVWWTQYPLIAPVLVGWSGGPPAVKITGSGDVEAIVLRELARVFSSTRSRIERLVDSIHTHDWTRDRFSRGAYSYVGIGGVRAPRVLARPIEGRLFVAGEATDTGTGGTVEGALASGKRAARQVLEALSV
jgi:monoamine oxidase